MISFPKQLHEATSVFEHMCKLDFNEDSGIHRLSSIICTIGSSCRDEEKIYEMVKAGMNIARLNFSYDSRADHYMSIQYIRQAEARYSNEIGYDNVVAIAGDLKGREIRTGVLANRSIVELKQGDIVKLTTKHDVYKKCTKDLIYIDYPGFMNDVKVGQKVFLDDNLISLEILEVNKEFVVCRALINGKLKSRVTVTVPEAKMNLPIVSEKDASDIKFCIDNQVQFLILSKIYTAEDVIQIRQAVGEHGKYIRIITKLENCRALENFDGIANESDALIFSRVDLAIELKVGKVFLAQKAYTARCIQKGKPFIVGPRMLTSMFNSVVPYRSDISDIGNVLVDGVDGIMLACVTSIGRFPVEAVKVLDGACKEAEITIWNRKICSDLMLKNLKAIDASHAVAISAVMTSVNILATAIIVLTSSGRSAALLARYRPRCPIIAVTRNDDIARIINLYRGVIPIKAPEEKNSNWDEDIEIRIKHALYVAYNMRVIRSSDAVVVVNPWKNATGFTNNIRVIYAYFQNDHHNCRKTKEDIWAGKGPARMFLSI